jgi:hypothetical protein
MRDILEKLAGGQMSIEEAELVLKSSAIDEITDLAKIDVNRDMRKGFPEVILAEGKCPVDVAQIGLNMVKRSGRAIISRATPDYFEEMEKICEKGIKFERYPRARMAILRKNGFKIDSNEGKVGVLTAGTSDIPVAEEVKIMAEEMGCSVYTSYDAGVAGIHRLFPVLKDFLVKDLDVLVVIAGREGALPTVVSGLVDIPIIGVPTSIGYGYGGGGTSALMSMLQACSMGIAVVNIDGGVAAGCIAALIAKRAHRKA